MQKIVIVANGAPYGSESLFNSLRLAIALREQESNLDLRLFLMSDAVTAGLRGQKPGEGYNIQQMLEILTAQNVPVKLCKTCTDGRGAIVHNHRTLNGLDDLADSDVVRTDLETHATVDATQALHNTGLDQTVLNRAGKRIRDIDLFGSGANRKQTLRILGKHRQHAKGVISLPRYVHFSPFKEYEQLERAPGPSLCRDAK